MPRISLSFAEVSAAFEKLLTHGEQPTAEKIQALLGKGNLAGIQKFLVEILAQSRSDLTAKQGEEEPSHAPKEPLAPPAPTETSAEPSLELTTKDSHQEGEVHPTPSSQRRLVKRERFTRHPHSPPHSSQNHSRHIEVEEVAEPSLEQLSDEVLTIKIRRLESSLMKEQMRREMAERIMEETREYADSIKEQVSQRINDLRQTMDLVIEQLKTQLREQKQSFDQDLKLYQDHLNKANEKIVSLLK